MKIELVSRDDLSKVLETAYMSDNVTVHQVLITQCPFYNYEKSRLISAYADGVKIPYELWHKQDLTGFKTLKLVIEAGISGVVAGYIALALAVASAAYSLIMMSKLNSQTGSTTEDSSSIYNVNAQGNKVNLQSVIPENFGLVKRYPDYLTDRHTFYRNNIQFLDMILCQGVGEYARADDQSDIYIGNTPFSEYTSSDVRCQVFGPGESLVNNLIENGAHKSWYSSTEVTASGKSLNGTSSGANDSTLNDLTFHFNEKSFVGYYKKYIGTNQYGESNYITATMELKWESGTYFNLSGVVEMRQIANEQQFQNEDVIQDNTNTTTTINVNNLLITDNVYDWLRVGDTVKINSTKYGYSGYGQSETIVYGDLESFEVQIVAVSNVGSVLTLTTTPWVPDVYPDGGVIHNQYLKISVEQPKPDDYGYSDNDVFVLKSEVDGEYFCHLVDNYYNEVDEWHGFWSILDPRKGVAIAIDDSQALMTGEPVGPYRACPIGASANEYEVDIEFPNGLGYLNSGGGFDPHTVDILIEWRLVDSNDEWSSQAYTKTASTSDQLADTVSITTATVGAYEFRLTNKSETSDDSALMDEVKWVGLKSCVSAPEKYDNMTVLLCRFRGSETLSELSDDQISTFWTRKLPNITTGEMTATQDIAPALLYILKNSKYGDIINHTSLETFNNYWNENNFKLNGTFDTDNTLLTALRDCLKAGMSELVADGNKVSFARMRNMSGMNYSQLFTMQNMTSCPRLTVSLRRDDDVKEIECQYMSPETWKTETFYSHLDSTGNSVITTYPTTNNYEKLELFAVTNRVQAEVLATRRLKHLTYTRLQYAVSTELDGLNCQYLDYVGLVLPQELSNITGRVVAYNSQDLIINVDQDITQLADNTPIYIRKKDGTSEMIPCSRISNNQLQLAYGLSFEWDINYGSSLEFPFFAIGEVVPCWVSEVRPSEHTCSLTLVNYDQRMFNNDPGISAGFGLSEYGTSPFGY